MTTFNSISNLPDPMGAVGKNTTAGSAAGGSVQPGTSAAPTSPDVDVAQRIARRSAETLPQTRQLLESIASDVATVETIQQAAGTLSDAAERAPAFDASGVSAALATIAFALEQGREFAEKLKTALPSIEAASRLSVDVLRENPAAAKPVLANLQSESTQTRQRLAALAEELAGRNERIASRTSPQPMVENLTAAMQAQSRRGLASAGVPPGGQSQVSSLLSDLGLGRSTVMRSSSSATADAVGTLMSRLQKQFPDVK